MNTHAAHYGFDYPEGTLWLREEDLDFWAEHCTWCLRALGVEDGAMIGIEDYGTSPLSYLSSSLFMPLGEGFADRLRGSAVCVDASHQRVAMTVGLVGLLPVDTLIVRSEVAAVVLDSARREGVLLEQRVKRLVQTLDGLPPGGFDPRFGYLLVGEASLLIAPYCRTCGGFHLRDGYYDVEGRSVHNRKHPGAPAWEAPTGAETAPGACRDRPHDIILRLPKIERGAQ